MCIYIYIYYTPILHDTLITRAWEQGPSVDLAERGTKDVSSLRHSPLLIELAEQSKVLGWGSSCRLSGTPTQMFHFALQFILYVYKNSRSTASADVMLKFDKF